MDLESTTVIILLETIGQCYAYLTKFGSELQKKSHVLSTESVLDCIAYPVTGTSLSFYLDVELKDGNSVTYFLGISWDDKEWNISADISINDDQGNKVIKKFPESKTGIFEELITKMVTLTKELIQSPMDNDYFQQGE